MAAKSRKKRSTRQTKKKKQEQSFLRDEVTIWLTLAVSILIMLSNFGLGGSAGAKASHGFILCIWSSCLCSSVSIIWNCCISYLKQREC